jgi:hypothetical protein
MNPPADEDAFNAWYDDEHAPLRLGTPGFRNGRRYKAVTEHEFGRSGPRYLALYDLDSPEVLDSEPYKNLTRDRSEREKRVLAQIPMTDRRVMELLIDGPEWTDDAPFQLVVCMTPPHTEEAQKDFVDWYRQEHIDMLLRVPGWRRVRLFRQLDGNGPDFMAIHELESPAVFDHVDYERAISTPWREKIRSSVSRYERNLFALWRGQATLRRHLQERERAPAHP